MKYANFKKNLAFIGREYELERLNKIYKADKSAIIVVTGRRRVGKTQLIEHFFINSNVLKFEGIQTQPPRRGISKTSMLRQITECVQRLGAYCEQEALFNNLDIKTWTDFFKLLTPIIEKNKIVLYFEEVQWLACYNDSFLAEMKPFWDDTWRHNKHLRIVLSGSSPSFLLNQFLSNKALYNRSEHYINLQPFDIYESAKYLKNHGKYEKLLAALFVGGIAGYLEKLKDEPSVLLGFYNEAFRRGGYFSNEYERIFVSSLSNNKYYLQIIEELAKHKYLSREDISKIVTGKTNTGGSLSRIIKDLEDCGFIASNYSIHLKDGGKSLRYTLVDEYIQSYHSLILPKLKRIKEGEFNNNALNAIDSHTKKILLGLAFERWCRKNHKHIASILGFKAVEYIYGPYFSRASEKIQKGFQIDLIYIRKDHKILICEVKYYEGTIPEQVANEIQRKQELFLEIETKYKNYTIECVLITTGNLAKNSRLPEVFKHIVTIDMLIP